MGLITRLGGRIERARNLDIKTSADLAAFILSGSDTWAGTQVSEQTAMNVAAFFAGIRYVSEDIGKLPWPVYERVSDDERRKATDSPYWRLLHDEPNGWQDSQQFRELGTTIAMLRGDFVALKNVVRGEVRELLPVKPSHVVIEQDEGTYELTYRVRTKGGVMEFTQDQVFHFRGYSLDGVHGASILALARQDLGVSLALLKHGAATFKNGAKPGGVYKHPGELSERAFERLKADLDELKGEGAGGALILEEGMDWTQIGMSNEDAEFLASNRFQITQFSRWIRIAPHKLFELERSTFTNIEHQSIEYVQDTLMTWGQRWDSAARRQVLPRSAGLYAEHNYDAQLMTTSKERAEVGRIAVGRPWMTGNEFRRLNNLPPSDQEDMDQVAQPKNLGPETTPLEAENAGAGNAA